MSTARDVITALLSHRELPERMGLAESFWPHILDNAWGEQGMASDTDLVRHFDLDIACVHWCDLPGPRPDLIATLSEDDECIVSRDAWGAITKGWKHRAGTPEHIGFTLSSSAAWFNDFRDAFLAQDPLQFLDLNQSSGSEAITRNLQQQRAEGRFATMSFMFVFEWLRKVMGDLFMLESLLLEPDLIHDFNRAITDRFLTIYDHIFRTVGLPDGIHFYDDLAYTAAPFASPDCHRELVLPYHREIVGFFKDHGLPVIMHTCGDFRPHLPAIVESGVDCIQALEAKTGMDVVELAHEWKDHLCFFGNLDIRAFESGDRTRIDAEIDSKIGGMRRARAPYIIASDHSIPPSVTLDDYRYALARMRAQGTY